MQFQHGRGERALKPLTVLMLRATSTHPARAHFCYTELSAACSSDAFLLSHSQLNKTSFFSHVLANVARWRSEALEGFLFKLHILTPLLTHFLCVSLYNDTKWSIMSLKVSTHTHAQDARTHTRAFQHCAATSEYKLQFSSCLAKGVFLSADQYSFNTMSFFTVYVGYHLSIFFFAVFHCSHRVFSLLQWSFPAAGPTSIHTPTRTPTRLSGTLPKRSTRWTFALRESSAQVSLVEKLSWWQEECSVLRD